MSVMLNIKIIKGKGVVVIRGLEFPNVVVEGKTEKEAKQKFIEALEYFFIMRKQIEIEKYPISTNEKVGSIRMELVENGII